MLLQVLTALSSMKFIAKPKHSNYAVNFTMLPFSSAAASCISFCIAACFLQFHYHFYSLLQLYDFSFFLPQNTCFGFYLFFQRCYLQEDFYFYFCLFLLLLACAMSLVFYYYFVGYPIPSIQFISHTKNAKPLLTHACNQFKKINNFAITACFQNSLSTQVLFSTQHASVTSLSIMLWHSLLLAA